MSCRLESQPHSPRRLPRPIGFIPGGNRRWAEQPRLAKEQGHAGAAAPGLALFEACKALGVEEVSVFEFTQDNTRRPRAQANRLRAACVAFAVEISRRDAALLIVDVSRLDLIVRRGGGRRLSSGGGPPQRLTACIGNHASAWLVYGTARGLA